MIIFMIICLLPILALIITILTPTNEYAERFFRYFLQKKKPLKKWKTEEKCRKILESILKEPCPSVRPDFLRNPRTGYCLELDCYCEKYRIALEFNGKQHYKYPNRFHRSKKAFKKQLAYDRYKIESCKRAGIYLISVPYTKRKKLKEFILQKLSEYDRLEGSKS